MDKITINNCKFCEMPPSLDIDPRRVEGGDPYIEIFCTCYKGLKAMANQYVAGELVRLAIDEWNNMNPLKLSDDLR
jgi:hypothetical protein